MIPTPRELIHLCTTEEWEHAKELGERRPPSLGEQGFVHLSAPEQVHLPANRLFAGRSDMLLLRLDANLLGAKVNWEPGVPSDPESMTFPHLYGPLPVAAVTSVTPYRPAADGRFAELPHSET
ncbi:MAG: glutathione S-transferase [Mycobacterium sp.]|nr:glutathione S-transferase [Mycobacterium sp.]